MVKAFNCSLLLVALNIKNIAVTTTLCYRSSAFILQGIKSLYKELKGLPGWKESLQNMTCRYGAFTRYFALQFRGNSTVQFTSICAPASQSAHVALWFKSIHSVDYMQHIEQKKNHGTPFTYLWIGCVGDQCYHWVNSLPSTRAFLCCSPFW